MTASALFEQVLGDAFSELSPTLRALHAGSGRWRGEAIVERGAGIWSRCAAWMTGLPPAGEHAVIVNITGDDTGERWVRRYGTAHAMPSRLWWARGALCERLGPFVFTYRMTVEHAAILWRVASVRLFGILPLPAHWFVGVQAREYEAADRYCFDVRAELPMIGLLVHYRGWLEPV